MTLPTPSGVGCCITRLEGGGAGVIARVEGLAHVDAQAAVVASFKETLFPEGDGSLVVSSALVKAYVIMGHSVRVLAQADSTRRTLVKHAPVGASADVAASARVTDVAVARGWSNMHAQCELLATADVSGRVMITGLAVLASDPETALNMRLLAELDLVDAAAAPVGTPTLLRWHPTVPQRLYVARGAAIWCVDLAKAGVPTDAFLLGSAPQVFITHPSWLSATAASVLRVPVSALDFVGRSEGGGFIHSFDVISGEAHSEHAPEGAVPWDLGNALIAFAAHGDDGAMVSLHVPGANKSLSFERIVPAAVSAAWPTPLAVRLVRASDTSGSGSGAPTVAVVIADSSGNLRLATLQNALAGAGGACSLLALDTQLAAMPALSRIIPLGGRAGADGAPSPDASNPLPGFIDPITLEPVTRPAMSPAGHVMGAATWKAVLAERGACPFTKAPLSWEQCVLLTHANNERYRDRIRQ